jgi:DNA helicase-4
MVSLNGETSKSFEEAEIANFLCLKGVPYRYESD